MARTKKAPASLALFPQPTSAEAWALVERYPLGCSFIAKYKKNREGVFTGPYYVARWTEEGEQLEAYVGTEDKRARVAAAQQLVAAELEKARRDAETPELRRVRELEARAGKVKRAKPPTRGRVASIPILRFGSVK